jgi:dihydrofolate reductase
MISIVVAVANGNAIGKDNRLLCCIAEDMERFKRLTTGHAVIMGRKTFASLPNPLPERTNIVMSRTMKSVKNVMVATSFDNALSLCNDEEIFVIGGESVYEQALARAQRIYLTQIYADYDADTFFPQLDSTQWQEVARQHFSRGQYFLQPFAFVQYERVA